MTSSVTNQIMQNANNSAIAKAQAKANGTAQTSSSVSSDAFLNLMCMQLQYQDPTNPMDNSQMLAQEAQFVTLEQMEKLTSSFSQFSSIYQANSLIGQTVEIKGENGDVIKGVVDFVDYSDKSGASVSVNGTLQPLANVTKVYPNSKSADEIKQDEADKNFFKEVISYGALHIGDIAQKLSAYLGIGDSDSGNTNTPPNNESETP